MLLSVGSAAVLGLRSHGERITRDPGATAAPVAPVLAALRGTFSVKRELDRSGDDAFVLATFEGDRVSIQIDSKHIKRRIVDVEPGGAPGTATVMVMNAEGKSSLATVSATDSTVLTLEDEDGSTSRVTVDRLPLAGTVLRVAFDDGLFPAPVIFQTVWSGPFFHRT